MRITRITLYQVDLPFDQGVYRLSGGRTWKAMDSTLIKIDTDEGLVGWGETCPFGPNYLEAFAAGARAGIGELARSLLGQNPAQPEVIYAAMDNNMLGHPYVKHGIDMACWDILGKLVKKPLYTLFGGMLSESVRSAGTVPPEHGDLMQQKMKKHRANGCRQFSTKASGNVEADIEFISRLGELMQPGESVKIDANGGWRVDQAMRIMRATEKVDAMFEQPCSSYEDCRTVRRSCNRPIVLDECALDLSTVIRGWHEGVCDAVNLKIGRVGGLTPALKMRNLCVSLGIPFHVQCTGGSEVTQAAIVHLAHASPASHLMSVWDIGDLTSMKTVSVPLLRRKGRLRTHDIPGLGVEPIEWLLGDQVAVYD